MYACDSSITVRPVSLTVVVRASLTSPLQFDNPDARPFFALVRRSSPDGPRIAMCSFVKKVLNAQIAGRRLCVGVIVIDNQLESLVTMDSGDDDDSQADERRIAVASGFVSQDVGALLMDRSHAGPSTATLSWPSAPAVKGDGKVNVEMWLSSNDECSKCETQNAFLSSFTSFAVALQSNGYMTFQPRYAVLVCKTSERATPFCQASCINGGRYCAADPDEDPRVGYSGADVVLANLRSLCVHSLFNASATPQLWWAYSNAMLSSCSMSRGTYSIDCSDRVLTGLNATSLAPADVARCAGDTSASVANPMLEAQLVDQNAVIVFPSISVNGQQYRGDVEKANVVQFVCSAFANSAMAPPECLETGVYQRACDAGSFGRGQCAAGGMQCISTSSFPYHSCTACPAGATSLEGVSCTPRGGHSGTADEGGMGGGAIFGIILLILCCAAGGVWVWTRWPRWRALRGPRPELDLAMSEIDRGSYEPLVL